MLPAPLTWWPLTLVPVWTWLLWQLRTQERDPGWRSLLLCVGLARLALPPDGRVWGSGAVLCLLAMLTFAEDRPFLAALYAGAATLLGTASGPEAVTLSLAWTLGWLLPWAAGERVLALTALTIAPDPRLALLLLAGTGVGDLTRLCRAPQLRLTTSARATQWPWLLLGAGVYAGLRGWGA